MSDLKPNLTYESKTNIQFFYDNKEEADRIETYLPEILATLKKSPFYTNDESLVLIEKFQMPNFEFINKNFDNTGGFFLPIKQYSYYLVEPNRSFTPELTYYSHNNRYRAVIIHELTHQLISRFYGKWFSLFFIPTWKNEGYAEYLTAQGYYSTKSELRAILYENNISDQTLEDPFSKKRKNKYDLDDYMSAFLQTRYALDVQKISEPDFMKDAYQPASARTIREWLANEE
ncbi:MAG: hypothetical protein FJ161_00450 [Gammaproteobacteria bacterium]|nr:hypothetical protein [Gammaproteobacteria bacterium]